MPQPDARIHGQGGMVETISARRRIECMVGYQWRARIGGMKLANHLKPGFTGFGTNDREQSFTSSIFTEFGYMVTYGAIVH